MFHEPNSETDDGVEEFLQLLNDTLDGVEGPSPDLVDRAIGLFALRHFDAELLTLLTDSAGVENTGVLRSQAPTWRVVAFKSEGFTLELEVAETGERSLIGQLDPPDVDKVRVFGTETSVEVDVDGYGRFRVAPLPPGPFRVLATRSDGSRMITPVLSF